MNKFNEIDNEMPLTIMGYYYDEGDLNKSHAHFKENCILKINDGLSLFVTNVLQKSDLEQEIQERMQVLSKCTETERSLISSWHDVKSVINLLMKFSGIKVVRDLITQLNEWKNLGVQEIAFDWYKKIDGTPERKRFFISEEYYLNASREYREALQKLRDKYPPFKIGSGSKS